MHMPTNRCETRSIAIPAPPSAVLDLVGDATSLPRWAPNFTQTVEPDGEYWIVDGGVQIDVRVSPEYGTVDILRPGTPGVGAFSRVLPNGDGCQYLFTLFFGDGTPEEAVARQMEVVEEELRTIRQLALASSESSVSMHSSATS